MSIIYIGQSQAKPEELDNFRNFLTSIEIWTSVEAHRAAVKNIPAENINEFMKLVAAPPSGGYYRIVS